MDFSRLRVKVLMIEVRRGEGRGRCGAPPPSVAQHCCCCCCSLAAPHFYTCPPTQLDGRNPAKDAQVGGLLAAVGFDRVPKAVPAAGEQPSALNRFNTVFVHRSAWGALAHAPHIKEVVQQR